MEPASIESDWEVEIGPGAPVIEAHWSATPLSSRDPGTSPYPGAAGFIDLRRHPERIVHIGEAAAYPPLAALLLALNAQQSPLWTSKCDLWEPEPGALASYIDMLPLEGAVFARWQQAESFCRDYVARLAPAESPARGPGSTSESDPQCSIALIVRQAIAGPAGGFGITAYLSARAVTLAETAAGRITAAGALAFAMASFADALPPLIPPEAPQGRRI